MAAIQTCSFLSFDAVKADLQEYIKGLDDYQTWVDFFESGAGEAMIELMAGTGSMFNYRIDTIRRESYISEAKLTTSIYLIAQALGYNVRRKTAPRFSIRADIDPGVGNASIVLSRGKIGTLGTYTVSIENDNTEIKKAIASSLTVGTTTNYVKAAGGNKAYIEDNTLSPFGSLSADQEFTTAGSATAANNGTYTVFNIVSTSKVEIVEDFDTNEAFLEGTTLAALGRKFSVILGTWKTYSKTITSATDFASYLLGSTDYQISSDVDANGLPKYAFIDFGGVSKTLVFNREDFIGANDILLLSRFDGDCILQFGDGINGAKPAASTIVNLLALETPGQVLDAIDLSLSLFTSTHANITNIQQIAGGDIATTGTNEEATKTVQKLAPRYYASVGRAVTLKDSEAISLRFTHFQSTQVRETPSAVCEMDVSYVMNPENGAGAVGVSTSFTKAAGGNKAYLEDTTLNPFGGLTLNQTFNVTGANTAANNGTYTVFSITGNSKVEVVEDFNTNEAFLAGTSVSAIHILTAQEIQDFKDFYEVKHKIAGTKINLIPSTRKEVDFKMTVIHETSAATGTLQTSIEAILDAATLQLGVTLFVGSIIKSINALSGVIRVYMEYPYEDRALNFGEYYKRKTVSITFTSDQTSLNEFKGDSDPGNPGYI